MLQCYNVTIKAGCVDMSISRCSNCHYFTTEPCQICKQGVICHTVYDSNVDGNTPPTVPCDVCEQPSGMNPPMASQIQSRGLLVRCKACRRKHILTMNRFYAKKAAEKKMGIREVGTI